MGYGFRGVADAITPGSTGVLSTGTAVRLHTGSSIQAGADGVPWLLRSPVECVLMGPLEVARDVAGNFVSVDRGTVRFATPVPVYHGSIGERVLPPGDATVEPDAWVVVLAEPGAVPGSTSPELDAAATPGVPKESEELAPLVPEAPAPPAPPAPPPAPPVPWYKRKFVWIGVIIVAGVVVYAVARKRKGG